MALDKSTVWEVRVTNGVDTNGGGFVPGSSGTDYSTQNAAQYALTGVTSSGAGAVALTASAAADMVGNIVQVISGTNFTAGFYQIISVSVGVSITVDRNLTTGVGATGVLNIGGALKTLGKIHTIMTGSNQNATGQIFWVKAEATVSVSSGTTISPNGGNGSYATQINAYTTTRGDNGQLTIQRSSGTGFTILTMQPTGPVILRNFIVDGNSGGTLQGTNLLGAYIQIENCIAKNCPSGGFLFNNTNNKAINCQATGNGSYGFSCEQGNGPNLFIDCVAYSNTGTGFFAAVGMFIRCIAANNSGGTSDGFGGTNGLGKNSSYCVLDHCLAYSNGRDGLRFGSAIQCNVVVRNCVAWGNSGTDVDADTNTIVAGGITFDYNAYVNLSSKVPAGAHDVVLTGDPTTAGGSNNFALNNTAGAGAACRAAGFPGALPTGGTGNADLGPLQSAGAGSTTINYIAPRNTTIFVEAQ